MKYIKFFIFLFFTFSAYAVLPKKVLKPLIYIDAGHGGRDLGAVIRNPRLEEKRYSLLTAHFTKRYLENLGYRVSLTRSRDFYISLRRRTDVANNARASLFLSIHFNSCSNKKANGIEVYYPSIKNSRAWRSRILATNILNKVVFRTKAKKRGIKRGNFFVLRETKMPSILIEAGFLTNFTERNNIRKREYLNKIARGIAEGVDTFVKRK